MIDIDYFKAYNDYYGHQRGDQCLKTVAKILSGQLRRGNDLLARYGGEEFAVVMAESGAEAAFRIAVEHSPRSPLPLVSVSVGVACMLPRATQAPTLLVEYSDRALYAAKARGRNQAVLFDDLNPTASILD